jgi:hypothetical protein
MKNSQLAACFLKDTWDLVARGIRTRELSDCVEGSLQRLKPRKEISVDERKA